jgi:hypothetical protein
MLRTRLSHSGKRQSSRTSKILDEKGVGRGLMAMSEQYLTNEVGDIYAIAVDGEHKSFDPGGFGWSARGGKTTPDLRRSIEEIQVLPGFLVEELPGRSFVPGPKRGRAGWLQWKDGAAPPAAAESKEGLDGTRAYSDRLTDALGIVAERLPGAPGRSPFMVYDFLRGRVFRITYTAQPVGPGGPGKVYVLDDGLSFKIGYTEDHVSRRVAALQTGNPRRIETVLVIRGVTYEVESHLHAEFGELQESGEWFWREGLMKLVAAAGGWPSLLRSRLGDGDWQIEMPPRD